MMHIAKATKRMRRNCRESFSSPVFCAQCFYCNCSHCHCCSSNIGHCCNFYCRRMAYCNVDGYDVCGSTMCDVVAIAPRKFRCQIISGHLRPTKVDRGDRGGLSSVYSLEKRLVRLVGEEHHHRHRSSPI